MTNFAPFDAADYLDDEETIAAYLTAALEDPNPDVFLAAVRDVARARGMTQLAKDAGIETIMNPLLLDLPTEFTSDRLQVRCYRPGDGAMYHAMLQANQDHLYEFLPASLMAVHSAEDAEVVFRRLMADWTLRNLFIFGLWEKTTGTYVGETYLANADWEVPRIEVGYFIVQDRTRQGYATEAARATIRYAFEHLQVLRVDLRCAADNAASRRVAERCGFVQEGRFRQHHRKKAGTLVDMLWYGLLLSEWQDAPTAHPNHSADQP